MPATPISPLRPPLRGPAPPSRGTAPARSLLRNGLFVSAIIHAFVLAFVLGLFDSPPHSLFGSAAHPGGAGVVDSVSRFDAVVVGRSVDVEIAPRPPTVEAPNAEVAAPPERKGRETAAPPTPDVRDPHRFTGGSRDAGVDVVADAAPRKKRRPRPIPDAGQVVALADGGPNEGAAEGDGVALGDAGIAVATGEVDDANSAQSAPSEDDPAQAFVGTAANLLAYFPPGQVVTALVRFDRLRGTEWADAAEELLRPMPDYRALFGPRAAQIHSAVDVLAISSPRPRDAKATTLVMKTPLSRGQVRELLANPASPIAWSASGGGLVGKRGDGNDSRILLSPWQQWYVLASPRDLSGLLAPQTGELDEVEATAALPSWLSSIREIEGEAGKDKRGPALVVTVGRQRSGSAKSARYALPGLGLGVSSLPLPRRASVALELVKQGWLVRGTMRFSTDAEAGEFVQSVRDVQQRILASFVLSAIVARQHGRNALEGLSLLRSGDSVSYATSLSSSDARAVLAAIARALTAEFEQ